MKPVLFAPALLATALLTLPFAAQAQTQTPAVPEVQATAPIETTGPTPTLGVTPAQIAAWLTTQGLTPGAVQMDGDNPYLRVTDGPLTWLLFFQSCTAGVCADLQFSTGLQTPAVTLDGVNGWNRDRRFLKAFYEAPEASGGPATAVVQYDLFLRPGAGPEQLTDHLAVWRGVVPEFVRLFGHSGAAVPAPAAN